MIGLTSVDGWVESLDTPTEHFGRIGDARDVASSKSVSTDRLSHAIRLTQSRCPPLGSCERFLHSRAGGTRAP